MYKLHVLLMYFILYKKEIIPNALGNYRYETWNSVSIASLKIPENTSEVLTNDIKLCILKCFKTSWCNLACWDNKLLVCKHSNIIVTTSYIEDSTTLDAQTCYTKRGNDLTYNKLIYSSPHNQNFPQRTKENLIDGFYSYNLETCFRSEKLYHAWLIVDLGSEQNIKKISYICQSNDFAKDVCSPIEVRVGHYLDTSGSLGNYTLLRRFTEPPQPGQEFEVKLKGVTARFVSYQMSKGAVETFQICHIQIQ